MLAKLSGDYTPFSEVATLTNRHQKVALGPGVTRTGRRRDLGAALGRRRPVDLPP
jgi:hypothetical protein